ncbi:MAG TPA: hypothetical protein VEK11_13695 [Thermoanaerobaculia bacterium]|nr:hypothetical protein [Thermoanaerobaculia bacterium]
MKQLCWVVAAALSAWACHLAVQHATPVDRALPLIAVAVTLLAAVSYPSLMIAVPVLIVAEVALPDEGMRLLAFGVAVAIVHCGALASRRRPRRHPGDGSETPAFPVCVTAVVLLRWIPLGSVLFVREVLLLALCLGIVYALGRTPFAVAVGVLVALFTPAMPLRTLLLPALVLVVAFFVPKVQLAWVSSMAVGLVMLFFAWSGVVARAFPYFLRDTRPAHARFLVHQALPANASLTLDVPPGTRALIVSGANVAHLRRGTPLGRIEPGNIDIRIGDASDWGYTRRAAFYAARNPLPRDPAGLIRDYGYEAWLDGAGRVPLPGARTIHIVADAALPQGASLQVEGFELER